MSRLCHRQTQLIEVSIAIAYSLSREDCYDANVTSAGRLIDQFPVKRRALSAEVAVLRQREKNSVIALRPVDPEG